MEVNKRKLNRIGIDQIIINNFTISNFDKLEKKTINTNLEYIEKVEKNHSLFHLSYSVNEKSDNKIYVIASLEFNSNRFSNKNNLYNATVTEVKKSLDKIIIILENQGITLDLTQARVKELELNMTIEQRFTDLEEVLLLIGRANYQKSLGMYSFNLENIPKKIKCDRSLYINQIVHN